MKLKLKIITILILVLATALNFSVFTSASEKINLCKLGSVTITSQIDDVVVPGGHITLYKVGEINITVNGYCFAPIDCLADYAQYFDDLKFSSDDACAIAENVKERLVKPIAEEHIGDDGKVSFKNLSLDLYLVVEDEPAPGYEEFDPFLVPLPYANEEELVYDLSAEPKIRVANFISTDVTDVTDDNGKTTANPNGNTDNTVVDLPKTGQLWWPVPLLASAGLLFFIVGIVMSRRKNSDENY